MTCICIDDLRPASFRGVGFYVMGDKGEYGRRNITHEYPMRDIPYVEDMGQKATKFTVNGYLFGDDWIAQKDAIVAACTARGPAILQLPTEAAVLVSCNTLQVSRSKDECGFYGLSFDFTVSTCLNAASAIGAVESLIGGVIASAIGPMTVYFDDNYVNGGTLPFVSDNQTARITQLSSDVIAAIDSSSSIDDGLSTDVVQAAISVYQNASIYAEPDPLSSVTLAAQPIPAQTIGTISTDLATTQVATSGVAIKSGASAIVPMIAFMIGGIGNSMTPNDAVTALTPLAQWSVNEPGRIAVLPPNSPVVTQAETTVSASDMADAENAALLCGMVRSFALMKLAQAISASTFRTRADAIQARANVVELFNEQIEEFSEDSVVDMLLSARDYCVQAISQSMTTLVPVLTINAPKTKPSLYWASRLYSDVYRAEELADRNAVASPAFMPSTFEALAR